MATSPHRAPFPAASSHRIELPPSRPPPLAQQAPAPARLVPRRDFTAIEGIRVIFNGWVVLLHSFTLVCLETKVNVTDPQTFRNLISVPYGGLVKLFAAQVDVFFVISGFLLSMQLLSRSEGDLGWADVIIVVVKKMIRLLPGALFVAVILFLVGDTGTESFWLLMRRTFVFEMNEEIAPTSLIVTWSNRVDVIAGGVLTAVIVALKPHLLGKNGYIWISVIVFLSMMPATYLYFTYPKVSVAYQLQQNIWLPLYIDSAERRVWMEQRFGIRNIPVYPPNDARQLYAHHLYLPWYSRMSPCFIGCWLAIAYIKSGTAVYQSRGRHAVYLLASLFVLSLPVLLGVTNAKLLAERLDPSYVFTRLKQPLPPTLSDLIATVALRPIFSSAAAYIIFRLLLPCDHPQAFKTLASFLSLPIFQRLGILTYSIYINHFRVQGISWRLWIVCTERIAAFYISQLSQ
jgi:peptidoglycan/LPS O-acetylase OafA/YrhL